MTYSLTALFHELARMRVEAMERRRQQVATRTAERALTAARVKAAIERRQVAMLKQARAALIREGLSPEAATTALIAIDHKRVPHVRMSYAYQDEDHA